MSDNRSNAKELDEQVVQEHLDALSKQFDCVQIFATRHEGSHGTVAVSMGKGDWYARYGLTARWSRMQEQGDWAEEETE